MNLNETHDPKRKSFVESANAAGADFPIQNLPFCVFSPAGEGLRGGVAIGDQLLDLSAALRASLFSGAAEKAARAASGPSLNALMMLGNGAASALRAYLSDLLRSDSTDRNRVQPLLVPQAQVKFGVPVSVGAFTDFLCSYDHTLRLSRTGDLPPAFKYLPIAYHSRASTVICDEGFHRPNAQSRDKDGNVRFGPEQALDFELEMGAYVGLGNKMGAPISLAAAPDYIFGYCLLNDWSARNIQAWESTPLGPFLGKSFATSISPFVVTSEALLPFAVASRERAAGDPKPLPYLSDKDNLASGALDITLDAYMVTKRMRDAGEVPARVTRTNFKHMYWNFAQMLTHHASNGCSLQPGDILGSGTTSGPTDESRACMAEISSRGSKPFNLPNGESRTYLVDGDEVIFRGRAERDGAVGIGFGECRGIVLPAVAWPSA